MKQDKLIILDMDNTVLCSRIDFSRMRQAVYDILDEIGCPDCKQATTARSIVAYERSAAYDPAAAGRLWQAIAAIEEEGLAQAVAEPGAGQALAYLSQAASIAILTNNRDEAAQAHLQRLGLAKHCDLILGRDSVPQLKPSPSGFRQIMAAYPKLSPCQMLAVGDAANDAHGALAAGIGFAAYNGSRAEDWAGWGIEPLLCLKAWDQAACDALLGLLPRGARD